MATAGGSDRVEEVLERIASLEPEEREELESRLEDLREKRDLVLSSSAVVLRDDPPDEDYAGFA